DIDDTCDVVHGYQQLSLWNGHYGERCFLPIHVYDTATDRPVAMLLRTGKTPSGAEAAAHIRRLIRHIHRHWPTTHITIRGDGHYGRPEVMDFCEAYGIDYVLGLPTNAVLRADPAIVAVADACATQRAEEQGPVLRLFAENLINLHKSQLASDRTSCRSANANQMRLILHTAAYWLMWRVQQAIPKVAALATAEFATLRVRLLKIAARVIETSTRIRVAFASACPDADLFGTIANALKPAPT